MAARIRLDVTRMMASAVGAENGITEDEIEQVWPRVNSLLQGFEAKRKAGELPFYDLPDDIETVERIEEFAAKTKNRFRNIVVLGIGGSSLGTIALRDALKPLHWNERPDQLRDAPRLFVPDNSDPELLGSVMELCPPEETLYNVITKSGTTAETMAAYLAVLTDLKEVLKDRYHDHLVFTTDSTKGNLRRIARSEGIHSFTIPAGVGGRFSVLTPVGLLPAALIGIDIRSILKGAVEERDRVFARSFEKNPSAAFALLQFIAHTERAHSIHVMMPYSNALYRTADWFRQLWAESLGKKQSLNNEEVFSGPTPIAALGATDQHSQMQLYVEGPQDKTFTFIFPEDYRQSVKCGKHHPDLEGIDYLAGKDIGELLKAEGVATQLALTAAHRPNMAFLLQEIAPDTIGGLMYLLEAATLVAGGLYEVNPLDQPGVEAGKIATYALLGRTGYEDIRAKIEKEGKRPARIVE